MCVCVCLVGGGGRGLHFPWYCSAGLTSNKKTCVTVYITTVVDMCVIFDNI